MKLTSEEMDKLDKIAETMGVEAGRRDLNDGSMQFLLDGSEGSRDFVEASQLLMQQLFWSHVVSMSQAVKTIMKGLGPEGDMGVQGLAIVALRPQGGPMVLAANARGDSNMHIAIGLLEAGLNRCRAEVMEKHRELTRAVSNAPEAARTASPLILPGAIKS